MRKETAFFPSRATDSHWNRNHVSRGSSVTAVILRPNSCVSSTARWFHVPAVSIATGTKTWLLASFLYLASLLLAALSAAAPAATVAVSRRVYEMWIGVGIWNCDIPCHWLSSCPREQRDTIWAFAVFTIQVLSQPEVCTLLNVRHKISFTWLWRCRLGALLRHARP